MPLFNFRRGGAGAAPLAGSAAQTESVEVMRKRAKHRLIGASVLVLIGVVGFPLLFDTQPRPIPVDIPIEIPAKNAVKPLTVPGQGTAAVSPAASPATSPAVSAAPSAKAEEKVAASSSLAPKEEIVAPAKPAASAAVAAKPDSKPAEPKPAETKAAAKPAASDDAARASALLNGGTPAVAAKANSPAADAADARLVVQVGAFAEVEKAREVRLKLERAGLKTYTQVAETKDGKRIRVRVGPFATRAEADKAASKIKTLDLPAAILTL
ncbi:SPOR domain-containing protein [Polaromonas sp. YR568]|uniref:SPOR domain-containing protein n=1 Tax=Polaromonas sp. YR568 TaxID=1855301 RepID=UPI003137FCAB